jgi:hypothetical protein
MIPGLAGTLIDAETNSVRFETFCLELFERVERRKFVPTSVTYDQGRDARTVGPARGSHAAIVCVTLNKNIDSKVQKDLDRVAATSTPDRLIYCSSQRITEDKIDGIAAQVKVAISPNCSVLVVGAVQIANLAEDNLDLVEKFYSSEINAIESAINAFERPSAPTESRGIKLALLAFGSEDAVALRELLSRRLTLEALRITDGQSTSIAARMSVDLCLPHPIAENYILRLLQEMQPEGLVQLDETRWVITKSGENAIKAVPPQAARELLAGRTVIRKKLEELIGFALGDKQYELIWSTLLDFLSELFHSNGLETIRAVNEFLAPQKAQIAGFADLSSLLIRGAHKISAIATDTDLGEALEQAVMDIFTERTGPAFEWLSRVCERFVSLCALGLEATSADEINLVIRRNHIVLDSRIIVSLLCETEPDFLSIRSLISRWRRAGGKILLSRPVLEEVAHHAWISENDFQNTTFLIGKLKTQDDLRRYPGNAFVRAFHFHCKNATDGANWPLYISQFRGRHPNDYSNLLPILQAELGAEMLSDRSDPTLEEKMCTYLLEMTAQHHHVDVEKLNKADVGKVKTDAHLLASIAANSEAYKQTGNDASIVLLTSSGRARRAHSKFREYLGPRTILATGTLSYLISMIPDTQLGAGALRGALFDFGETAHLQDSERLALLSCLSWNWRGRSSVKIAERTHEKRAEALHWRREGCDPAAAPVG